ncbi:MAG TPA: cbb3-type cytochrome c oxidase subunit I, partial [Gemmatimonadaceae bacterium]|nr:cbb3-type cytochrome c oxidase subunit I [Gemmatimonadaceae bacterium]
LPLGLAATDIQLHDTYYVIGHFHYIVATGTLFALFAGVYHWYPKVTGRLMNDALGRVHFWGTLVCMNLVFFPMFIQGLGGLNRRLYDGGMTYSHGQSLQHWNVVQGWGAWVLGLFQLVFIVNVFLSWKRGRVAGDNPWEATTLEWGSLGPGVLGSEVHRSVVVVRGPYEYSVPGELTDCSPQGIESENPSPGPRIPNSEIPYTVAQRPDTRINNVSLGMWLFIASEVMLFGGLFSAYVLLRAGAVQWGHDGGAFGLVHAVTLTIPLVLGTAFLQIGSRRGLALSAVFGAAFVMKHAVDYGALLTAGATPASATFLALYFLLTGVHALHVVGGVIVNAYLAARGERSTGGDSARFANRVRAVSIYWYFVDVVWLFILIAFYIA